MYVCLRGFALGRAMQMSSSQESRRTLVDVCVQAKIFDLVDCITSVLAANAPDDGAASTCQRFSLAPMYCIPRPWSYFHFLFLPFLLFLSQKLHFLFNSIWFISYSCHAQNVSNLHVFKRCQKYSCNSRVFHHIWLPYKITGYFIAWS